MEKLLIALSALFISGAAHANGIVEGKDIALEIAKALNHGTITCTAAGDHVTITVDRSGDLRMVAHYAGAISGDLDTNDEGDGAECGGLTAKQKSDYVLEDDYNDCERGDWGFAIDFSTLAMKQITANRGQFKANGDATIGGSKNGASESLVCVVK